MKCCVNSNNFEVNQPCTLASLSTEKEIEKILERNNKIQLQFPKETQVKEIKIKYALMNCRQNLNLEEILSKEEASRTDEEMQFALKELENKKSSLLVRKKDYLLEKTHEYNDIKVGFE